jgi:hypothetical protein
MTPDDWTNLPESSPEFHVLSLLQTNRESKLKQNSEGVRETKTRLTFKSLLSAQMCVVVLNVWRHSSCRRTEAALLCEPSACRVLPGSELGGRTGK